MASWLVVAGVLPAQAQTWSSPNLGGGMGVSYNGVANTYNAGYSMYVALLGRPQYAYYSSSFAASLEIGTWMGPQCSPGIYCDIEGGPGVGGGYGNPWCNTGFGIGAVAGNGFTNFANGTSSGNGVGVYGAAQISPCLLYPPKLEMFRNGTSGQFVGYGYLALPLLPGTNTTDGVAVPTGANWWTLFFNTRNFQGPVAVVTPHFYAQVTEANTAAAGLMLDSCWAGPNKQLANESHYVPAKEYDGPEGSYLRVEPVFAAINNGTNGSLTLNSPTAYDQTAVWNAAQQWFTNNGPAPAGPFNAQGAALQTVTGGSFGWGISGSPLGPLPMAAGTTLGFYDPDSATWGYQWRTNQVTYTQFANGTPAAVMPEYYQVQGGVWTPVSATAVPAAAQLASVSFDSGSPPSTRATYTVPNDPVWTNYAAGPFQVRIDDGNLVTYYWYRFEDQPAIMKAGLTQAQRDQLQAEVVKIHSAWTNGGTYFAPPTMGTLADVDPALLVTPPTNLPTVGYVPIATSEAWGGWLTNTWNQALSGNWSVASNWASAPADGGHSYYRLNFAPSGTYVATNDRSSGYGYGGFAVNQLNFAGAVTLTGNPITLTADVGSNPQINQNSGNTVVINTPLNLDVSTVLGGTGSGLVVISNSVSGPWHKLTINNSGTWRICGLTPNTYSGGTIITKGTVIWGVTTNGASPDCKYALGTGPVTLSSGATLQFEHASPTNALTLNGGTLYAANSTGVTWMGPVTLNSNTTVRTDYGMGISGNVSGAGSLTKTGTNTLTLSGVNSYTGANLVQAGTLACSAPASLGAGALSISNGAVVNLNYSGTRSIFSLTLGGTNMLAGVYGSPSSSATYQDAHFSGTGTVTVPVPISIANLPATGTATNQATLNARLGLTLAYGGTNATVLVYWGTADGGTNPAAWANSARVGAWTNIVSTNIAYTATGLAMNTNTTYYFGFLATNAVYTVWATNVLSFTTPTKLAFTAVPVYPPARYPFSVTVQAQDANGNPQTVTSATTVQLSKSSGSGTLSGTVSGTIVNGSSSVVISGLVYSAADTMTLTATASSGMSLTAAVSPPITFMPPDLTWDANGTGTGVVDGGGVWIATTNTWWNGTTNVNWADNYNARFGSGGAGGTITLGEVTANLVTFTNFSGTYTLNNGTLTVVSNLTVANSAGSVVLSSAIGGTGGVTMNSPGKVQFNYFINTYSGGTVINAGTVSFPTAGDGSVTPFFGTGPITINTNGTLSCNRTVLTNSITLNGGTVSGGNSFQSIFNGPVTLAGVSTINFTGGFQINGNVSGSGGLRSVGSSSWHLNGTNAYTGPTTIVAGTISFDKSVSVAPGMLGISDGAVANLNYTGTRTIAGLTLGGTNMSPGVYGSSSSSATYKDSHFSGSGGGTVTVSAQISITNSPATAITSTAAALNATLGCAATNAAVLAYWNTVNGGTTPSLWTNSAYLGSWTNAASTNLSRSVSSLAPGTTYYFTFRATNLAYNVWATNVLSFTTLGLPGPVVDNANGATNLAVAVAQLRGTLSNGPADVRLYWGLTDGGTSPASWANTNALTGVGSGSFSSNVSNLLYGLTYYYRSYASNQWGTAWAPATTNFTTLRPGSSLANSAATGITTAAAALNATLVCTGAVYQVSAFWNTVNGGTNATLWTNSASVGVWTNVASTNLSYGATGLAPKATYYFAFCATNALDTLWATNVLSFTTLSPPGPVVDNAAGATNLAVGVAQLRGTLANGPADVRLCWGTADGGTNQGSWANASLLGGAASGAFSGNLSNLIYGLTYCYRSYASNQWGTAWAPATASFTTLKPAGAPAGQIPVTSIVEVSASSETAGFGATNAFDGYGLSGDGTTENTSGGWVSSGLQDVPSQWLKVRFDQSYPLDYLRVWAFNGGNSLCVTNANVYVLNQATDPGNNVHLGGGPFDATGWNLQLANQAFTPNPSSGSGAETNTDPHISLSGVTARQLALKINAVYQDLGLAGFAQVQIYRLAPTPINLTNLTATGVTATTAGLNGTLACAGAVYDVYACWNTINGGANAALWTNSAYVGTWTDAAVTNLGYTATGLAPNTAYYFTFLATNALDTLWATNVQSFTTLASLGPPTPVLPVSGVTVANGVPSFSFTAAAGCKYRLDYKNALSDAIWTLGDWSTNATASPVPMTLSDPSASNQPQRFYRLEAANP